MRRTADSRDEPRKDREKGADFETVVLSQRRNCPHNPKVTGSNPAPATNPLKNLPLHDQSSFVSGDMLGDKSLMEFAE
jgi:hypothetical protein